MAMILTLVAAVPCFAQRSGMGIHSPAFVQDGAIPATYTCSAFKPISPPLGWQDVPGGTKTLVLLVKDPDAPHGTFIHWIVYNIPASIAGIPPDMPPTDHLAIGGVQGMNSSGKIGYMGPCPPAGSPHHYHFELLALDVVLNLKPGAKVDQVEAASKGHIKAKAELVGTFAR